MPDTLTEPFPSGLDQNRIPVANFGEYAMQSNLHTMSNLFAQLGLPSDPPAIDSFIASHRPLDNSVALYRAPFWSEAQRTFLKEEIIGDADWAGVIDELNCRLASRH